MIHLTASLGLDSPLSCFFQPPQGPGPHPHARVPSLHPAVRVAGPQAPGCGSPYRHQHLDHALIDRPPTLRPNAVLSATHGCRKPRAGRWASARSCPGTRRTWRRSPGPGCARGTASRAAAARTPCKTLEDRLRGAPRENEGAVHRFSPPRSCPPAPVTLGFLSNCVGEGTGASLGCSSSAPWRGAVPS